MTVHPNETMVRSMLRAFDQRDFDEIGKQVASSVEWHNMATGEVFRGPDEVRRFLSSWTEAFEDARLEVRNVVVTDEQVVTEFIGRGTHTGTFTTPHGSIPATKRAMALPFCEVATVENGKVTNVRTYFDAATLMEQLGVLETADANA